MVTSLFIDGRYEVAAGVKQQLESDARQVEGLRLLPGRFMVIEQAMGQPSGTSQAANEALTNFIIDMKSNGFVRDSLLRHHIEGASIAP
jgi:polar amino acid transport system substrate-binding protein